MKGDNVGGRHLKATPQDIEVKFTDIHPWIKSIIMAINMLFPRNIQ